MRLLLIFFLSFFLSFFLFLVSKDLNFTEDHLYSINEGDSYRSIKKNLNDLNVTFPFIVDFYFYLSGADKFLRKGEYNLEKKSDLLSITKKLSKGKIFFRSFYIPEGARVNQFLSPQEQSSFCSYKGLEICALEGMFHPNTYYFEKGEDLNIILNKAFNMQLSIAEENFYRLKNKIFVKNIYELIILASVLEKEACPNERRLISGVIYNRLENKMRLQIDSTVIYGIKDFDGNLKKKHLLKDTPFNTYTNFGLPPKPISIPSELSLIAAANPSESDYLFFVSKGKCSHHFSSDYKEHYENVKKYQLN